MRREAEISQTFPAEEPRIHAERQSQALIEAFLASGLFFLLLPGTFLGVWNLIGISRHEALTALSSAWLQAHGQAQVFGWVGSFILGIGFYSLTKMQSTRTFPVGKGWTSWSLWTCGVALRWLGGVTGWQWRMDPAGIGIVRTRWLSTLLLGRASPSTGQWQISETHVDGSGDFIHLRLPSYARHQRHCPLSTGAHGQYSGAATSARSSTCDDGNLGCSGAHYLGIQCAVAADLCGFGQPRPRWLFDRIRDSAWPASLWSFSINGESLL